MRLGGGGGGGAEQSRGERITIKVFTFYSNFRRLDQEEEENGSARCYFVGLSFETTIGHFISASRRRNSGVMVIPRLDLYFSNRT